MIVNTGYSPKTIQWQRHDDRSSIPKPRASRTSRASYCSSKPLARRSFFFNIVTIFSHLALKRKTTVSRSQIKLTSHSIEQKATKNAKTQLNFPPAIVRSMEITHMTVDRNNGPDSQRVAGSALKFLYEKMLNLELGFLEYQVSNKSPECVRIMRMIA